MCPAVYIYVPYTVLKNLGLVATKTRLYESHK